MKNLSHNDFQNILKAIEILNSDVAPESLPKRLLHSVNYAISSDITAFEMVSPTGEYQGILIYEPFDSISPQELEIYGQYLEEHPIYEQFVSNRRYDAIRITDLVSNEKFMQTGIYNEYYRRISISRQMVITMKINENSLVFCTLSRGGKDFDENERAILNLMSPHFTAAICNTNSFEQIQVNQQNWEYAAESTKQAIITLDYEGNIKYLSRQSEQFLEKYFDDEKLKINNIPHSLSCWITKNIEDSKQSKNYYLPPKPLVLIKNADKLIIRFNFNKILNSINLLLKEETELSPQQLLYLGLTKKETEILFWIVQGKTNYEIGLLCVVSPRTVQKHIEHICTKLGVENRTAAAIRAVENII